MFSSEALIKRLYELIKCVENGNVSQEDQKVIYDFIECTKPDPEMVKYLFTGWWIHKNAKE